MAESSTFSNAVADAAATPIGDETLSGVLRNVGHIC